MKYSLVYTANIAHFDQPHFGFTLFNGARLIVAPYYNLSAHLSSVNHCWVSLF